MSTSGKGSGFAGGCLALAATLAVSQTAVADSGLYIGGSVGGATLEADLDTNEFPIPGLPSSIDEDDNAFKVFAGYRFDLPAIDLGIEAGYVDFGQPEIPIGTEELVLDTSGVNVWGVVSFDAGLIDLFAKAGYVFWDVEGELSGVSVSDDGSDLGYGVGLAFGLGPVSIRGEYEIYDLDDADLSMLSLGIVYQFD
ncbi:MAG: porin family protein [Woeseiaceae bacterium]|nr:porin family protein [Woeseiaceae bacterium]